MLTTKVEHTHSVSSVSKLWRVSLSFLSLSTSLREMMRGRKGWEEEKEIHNEQPQLCYCFLHFLLSGEESKHVPWLPFPVDRQHRFCCCREIVGNWPMWEKERGEERGVKGSERGGMSELVCIWKPKVEHFQPLEVVNIHWVGSPLNGHDGGSVLTGITRRICLIELLKQLVSRTV